MPALRRVVDVLGRDFVHGPDTHVDLRVALSLLSPKHLWSN